MLVRLIMFKEFLAYALINNLIKCGFIVKDAAWLNRVRRGSGGFGVAQIGYGVAQLVARRAAVRFETRLGTPP